MHLKRYSMPEFWPLATKAESYVTTPMPGPHPKGMCIPLRVVVRDSLKIAESSAEARKILNSGKVMVDKKVRKEPHFPVGFMDVLEIPELHLRYRLNIVRKGLLLEKLKEDETGFKLCKITGKATIRGGAQQISLHDGRNMLSKGAFHIGDSLLIEIPSQNVIKHYPLKKGEPALIIAGKNRGVSGVIKEIKQRKSMLEKSNIIIETNKGKDIETLKDYVMVGSLNDDDGKKAAKKESEPDEKERPKKKAKSE